MKKMSVLAIACVLVLTVGSVGCTPTQPGRSDPSSGGNSDPIRIGYGLPVTGGSSDTALQIARGSELAISQANAAGGVDGRLLEMVLVDDRGDPKEAANIANLFVQDPSIVAVVGHHSSSNTLAAAPIYEKGKIVNITPNASSVLISEAGPYTFRCWNSDKHIVRFLVDALFDRDYKKIGIVYQNDDYGRGGFDIFSGMMSEKGLNPTVSEGYLPGETKDFSTIITKFKNSGTDAVYIISSATDISLFLLQCQQLGYKPFVIGNGLYVNTVLEVAAEAAEGACGMALYNPSNPPQGVADFIEQYVAYFTAKAKDGTIPTDKALCGYMATNMILDALRNQGTDRESIKEYLTDASFDTPLGELSFDEKGDVTFPLALMQVRDGKFVQAN